MKKPETNNSKMQVEEAATPYLRRFASQEEAERFNMIENAEKTDMEKFRLFCKMMRIGKMLASAKTISK